MKKLCFVLVLAVVSLWAEKLGFWDYMKKGEKSFLAKDYRQAKNYFIKACEVNTGYEFFNRNCSSHTAMEYFDRANTYSRVADSNAAEISMQLGNIYYEGNKELQVEKNIPLAKEYWGMVLNDDGSIYAPYGLEHYEILSYLEGRKKDCTKARLLAEIACEKNVGQACDILGDIYAQGKGVKQDLNKAKTLYQKACENPAITTGHSAGGFYGHCGEWSGTTSHTTITHYGCEKLGDIFYVGNNFSEARKWWAKGVGKYCSDCPLYCDDGRNSEDCDFEISGYYQSAEGYYNGYTIEEVTRYDKDNNLVKEKIRIKHELNHNKGVLLADIGCNDFKESKYCYIIADALAKGKGIIKSGSLAQQYLKKATQYHAKELYKQASEIERVLMCYYDYEESEAAKKEREERAEEIKELLKKACDLDKTSEACADLKNKAY